MCFYLFVFKQKTAYEMRISDWSSDVCSSDLEAGFAEEDVLQRICIQIYQEEHDHGRRGDHRGEALVRHAHSPSVQSDQVQAFEESPLLQRPNTPEGSCGMIAAAVC